jgi:hypothetical protein
MPGAAMTQQQQPAGYAQYPKVKIELKLKQINIINH